MTDYNNESELNNLTCEAAECFSRATDKIDVKAGTQKIISLLLCADCVSKFQETTPT